MPPPEAEAALARAAPNRLGVVFWLSAGWLVLLVGGAFLAPVLPIPDPEALGIRTGSAGRFEKPGAGAWFGADGQGRDLFSNVVWAARPALVLAVIATTLAAAAGTLLGVLAAHRRGRTDAAIMSVVDTALAFPALILLAAISGTLGNSLLVLAIVLAILGVPTYTRIVRATALSIVEREFVDAARSMGASSRRIIVREILPNITLPVVSFAFLGFALVIATEGALAFLNLSLDDTTWGNLIAAGAGQLRQASHLALIPATVMFLTILALNLVGDRLRELAETSGSPPPGRRRARPAPVSNAEPDPAALLSIRGLTTDLHTDFGLVRAVDGVSIDLAPGQTLGIVGESGSGKTMLLRSILGSFPIPDVRRAGQVMFDGVDLLTTGPSTRQVILGTRIGAVFQNPQTALNPVRRIGTQIAEPMQVHRGVDRRAARIRAVELLREVGIPDAHERVDAYPHQLSGGMRQRVTIAVALANEPRLLLADEPTTALDVTVQDQILRLLAELRVSHEMALVLVTHDLAVVRGWTDRVAVMYAGQIVEEGPTDEIFERPRMRYTEALLESIPRLDQPSHSELAVIEGQPPSLLAPPPGCRFAPRCPTADERCRTEAPALQGDARHRYACWHPAGDPIRESGARGR